MSSQSIRLGIIGAGWPGHQHARAAKASGGYKLAAVADLSSARRDQLANEFAISNRFGDAESLLKSADVDAVTISLPNHLHAPIACAALKAGKHVLLEKPPAKNAREARKIAAAAEKSGKTLVYAFQRRFGGGEQAARLAIEKGYAGNVYHARGQWLRTRAVGGRSEWSIQKETAGGGAMIAIGVHMLDLAWWLMGEPEPQSVLAATHRRFADVSADPARFDVEDAAFALIRFEGGASLEVSASFALNQPPQQQGVICRVFGDGGCIDVYTPGGAVIYRQFDEKGDSKPTSLKPPRLEGYPALMRHFRECILGKSKPSVGASKGVAIMEMIDAIYKSAETGRSVSIG
jgi:predicted dehydrogenase